jgi:hypothetical protein
MAWPIHATDAVAPLQQIHRRINPDEAVEVLTGKERPLLQPIWEATKNSGKTNHTRKINHF